MMKIQYHKMHDNDPTESRCRGHPQTITVITTIHVFYKTIFVGPRTGTLLKIEYRIKEYKI